MKLKVIGWVWYEDNAYPGGERDYAAYNAVVDDVRERGYCFTGYHHQEEFDCAPVLNDGKVRRFSQRGWGGLMADVKGLRGRYAYSVYAFSSPFNEDDDFVMPKGRDVDESLILSPEELVDEYRVKIRIDSLQRVRESGKLRLPDREEYRFTAEGDVIVFLNRGGEYRYRITHMEKNKKLCERDIFNYLTLTTYDNSEEYIRHVTEKYENAPWMIDLLLKPIDSDAE